MGVHLLADDDVAHLLRGRKMRHFFGKFGLVVDAVRRPEKKGFGPDHALDQALGEIEFPANLRVGQIRVFPVRMRVGVIPDFVPFRVFPAKQLRPLVRRQADHKEGRRDVLFLEHIEDFGSPLPIRPVVEGDGQFFLGGADLVDAIGERIGFVLFVGNEIA